MMATTKPATSADTPVIIAVDGGGSKTDAVALSLEGKLLATARGSASSPQNIGVEPARDVVDALANELLDSLGNPPILQANVYLSGLDLEVEITTFREALAPLPWTKGARPFVADNDMFALLRAGTEEQNAVAVVCGTGINCVGVRADGAHARFAALGAISGDWGGGSFLGEQAMWHAARALDGRGEATSLASSIPEHFELPDIQSVIEAFHFGRLSTSRLAELAPLILTAADEEDQAALSIVDRQAEEIVTLAVAAISRLELGYTSLPVVLGGGVLSTANSRLLAGITNGLAKLAPLARAELVRARPILGAATLALESAGATREAINAARAAIVERFATAWNAADRAEK